MLRFLEGTRVRFCACAPPPPPPSPLPRFTSPLANAHAHPAPRRTSQTAGSSPGRGHRVLHVEVADESDAFFLHTLTLGEAEYGGVRTDQALLVDFAGFPPHLLKLLESCVRSKTEAPPR